MLRPAQPLYLTLRRSLWGPHGWGCPGTQSAFGWGKLLTHHPEHVPAAHKEYLDELEDIPSLWIGKLIMLRNKASSINLQI